MYCLVPEVGLKSIGLWSVGLHLFGFRAQGSVGFCIRRNCRRNCASLQHVNGVVMACALVTSESAGADLKIQGNWIRSRLL